MAFIVVSVSIIAELRIPIDGVKLDEKSLQDRFLQYTYSGDSVTYKGDANAACKSDGDYCLGNSECCSNICGGPPGSIGLGAPKCVNGDSVTYKGDANADCKG